MIDRASDMRHILAQVSTIMSSRVLTEAVAPQSFVSLDALKAWAASLHVSLDVSEHEISGRGYDRVIDLSWIERTAGAAAGEGAKVVSALCRYADAQHAMIELQAADEINLPAYYEAFGFQEFEDEDADHDVRPSGPDMRRMPVGKRTGKKPLKAAVSQAPAAPRPSEPVLVVVVETQWGANYTVFDAASAQAQMDGLEDKIIASMAHANVGATATIYVIDTPDWTELRDRRPFAPGHIVHWNRPPERVGKAITPENNRWRQLPSVGKVIRRIRKNKRDFSVR